VPQRRYRGPLSVHLKIFDNHERCNNLLFNYSGEKVNFAHNNNLMLKWVNQ
jgi:hypothetical protein